jgi:tetratricopeptide (TPR) repeat protein
MKPNRPVITGLSPPRPGAKPAAIAPPAESVVQRPHWQTLLAAALLIAAGLAAYHNSFRGPFVLDDTQSIVENRSIRQLWVIGPTLSPPPMTTVAGRPLLNLTLALNFAIGRLEPRGYHEFNLALHLLAALTLMGVVRRTLEGPRLRERYGPAALPLAAAVALIWALHPLQTGAVTYVVQRAEALAGLFYLLTLYCAIGAVQARHRRRWQVLAMGACLLGVASKEVVVTVPLMVLLYDRTFVFGSFREAWRRRRGLYLALASTWLFCAFLMIRNYLLVRAAGHAGSSGFETGMSPWRYTVTQAWAIAHYLRLTFWPAPLVFDYGTWLAGGLMDVWLAAVLVLLLLAGTAAALWRRPMLGFLGAWFFVCLAPTSSFVPLASETIAERRMYLALAAPVTLVVVGAWTLWCRLCPAAPPGARLPLRRLVQLAPLLPLVLAATALAVTTSRRNEDYQSGFSIWQDTVRKRPENWRAHLDLGLAFAGLQRFDEAVDQYQQALALKPNDAKAYSNIGLALASRGRFDEAIVQYRKALVIQPSSAIAHCNLAIALMACGQGNQAIAHYQKALEIRPDFVEVRLNLADALEARGQIDQAIEQYRQALQLEPANAEAHYNLGNALSARGQADQAITQYQMAVRIEPSFAKAHYNLANILLGRREVDRAIEQYEQALRIAPDFAEAHSNLGVALLQKGQIGEAIAQFHKALEIKPDYSDARRNLRAALARQR